MGAMKGNGMTAYLKTKPYALHQDEGQQHQLCGAMISVKASSEQTGGVFNLFEVSCSSDFDTTFHNHYAEDVAIYVLAGALTFFWGSEKKGAVAGSYFFLPRGIPHGFRVEGATPAKILYMTIPAGFDRFVIEQERPVQKSEIEIAAARHKIEVIGPLPE